MAAAADDAMQAARNAGLQAGLAAAVLQDSLRLTAAMLPSPSGTGEGFGRGDCDVRGSPRRWCSSRCSSTPGPGLAASTGAAQDLVHALGAPPAKAFRLVQLPAAVPHIVSGCRLAAGSAVIAAVVGEDPHQGATASASSSPTRTALLSLPRAFGAALCIVVVSVVVFALAGAAERAVHQRWR